MRSWIKDPILLKDKEHLGIVFLFKTTAVAQDLKDIVNKFIEANPLQVMNDLTTAIANAEMISERIQWMAEGV